MRFHLIIRNDRTKVDTYMTSSPVTHDEGCTLLRKTPPYKHGRALLVDATGVEPGLVMSTPEADYFRV